MKNNNKGLTVVSPFNPKRVGIYFQNTDKARNHKLEKYFLKMLGEKNYKALYREFDLFFRKLLTVTDKSMLPFAKSFKHSLFINFADQITFVSLSCAGVLKFEEEVNEETKKELANIFFERAVRDSFYWVDIFVAFATGDVEFLKNRLNHPLFKGKKMKAEDEKLYIKVVKEHRRLVDSGVTGHASSLTQAVTNIDKRDKLYLSNAGKKRLADNVRKNYDYILGLITNKKIRKK